MILRRKKRIKAELISSMGGKCVKCGYSKSYNALEFHQLDKAHKSFNISQLTFFSEAKVKLEAEKCILVCANCHRELEEELSV